MKELINLIKMQCYSLLSIKKYIILVTLIGFATIFTDPSYIAFSSSMILMAINYSVVSYEDKSKMGYLIYSLPINPKKYVLSKYIYGFISIALVVFIAFINFSLVKVLNLYNLDFYTLGPIILAVFLIGLIINIVVVPLAIVVGFQNAKFIISILAIASVCFTPTLVNLLSYINFNTSQSVLTIVILAVTSMLTILSYIVTSNLYCKKDTK